MGGVKKGKKTVSFNLDLGILDLLDEYCEKERRTKSGAVEIALERLFEASGITEETENDR